MFQGQLPSLFGPRHGAVNQELIHRGSVIDGTHGRCVVAEGAKTSKMKLDAMVMPTSLNSMGTTARRLSDSGFGGVAVTETSRSAFLASTAITLSAPGLHISTGVAVAFPRSPMVTAGAAWELAEATGGKFRLGIGTQVKAHVVRRYSAEFQPPGPRMEEYVLALRAIFRAFAGEEKLNFSGKFWEFNLLPSAWAPGPISVGRPSVDVAAVNPWMLQMAGRCADGVHVHPLNTAPYLDTVRENVNIGATAEGRDPKEIDLLIPSFTVVGDSEEEQSKWRELARMQVGFYGSTPNYAFIFDQLGYEGIGEQLRVHQRNGDMEAAGALITDDVLSHFIVESSWDSLASDLLQKYGDIATRVILYFANPLMADRDEMGRFGEVSQQVNSAPGG